MVMVEGAMATWTKVHFSAGTLKYIQSTASLTMSIPDTKITPVSQCQSLTQRLYLSDNVHPWHKGYTWQTMSISDTKIMPVRQCPFLTQGLHPQHKGYTCQTLSTPDTKITPVRQCPSPTQKLHLSDIVHTNTRDYTWHNCQTTFIPDTQSTAVRQHQFLTNKTFVFYPCTDNVQLWHK